MSFGKDVHIDLAGEVVNTQGAIYTIGIMPTSQGVNPIIPPPPNELILAVLQCMFSLFPLPITLHENGDNWQ